MKINGVVCESAIEIGNSLYFPLYRGNSFYRYDKEIKESFRLGALYNSAKEIKLFRLYKATCNIDNKIYCFPWCGEHIVDIYHIDTGEITYIDIAALGNGHFERTEFNFSECIHYKNYIYAIGLNFPAILRINTEDDSVIGIKDWHDNKFCREWHNYLGYSAIIRNIAYIPVYEESAYIMLDLEDGTCERQDVVGDYCGFTNIIYDGMGHLFLLEKFTDRIVCTNGNGEVIKEYIVPNCPEKEDYRLYFDHLQVVGNGFYLFPVRADHIYFFNFTKEEFEICKEFEEITFRELSDHSRSGRRVFSFSTRKNFAYVVETGSRLWNELDLVNRTVETFKVNQANASVVKPWAKVRKESEKLVLQDMIDYLEYIEKNNIDPMKYI